MFVHILSIFNKRYRKSFFMRAFNIGAGKAAHVRDYFSRRNNFHLNSPGLLSLSLSQSVMFDQINAEVLCRRVNYLYLATFLCPVVFLYPVST